MSEAIEIYDDRMRELVRSGASLQKVANGAVHSEGPVYFHEDDSVVWERRSRQPPVALECQ